MTSPIERAAEALNHCRANVAGRAFGVPEDAHRQHGEAVARAVFESIDPDDLAQVLAGEGWTCEYHEPDPNCTECQTLHRATARALIARLTGKDQT